jgi:methylmalonyl-CoA mutase N-terminal domain/subunit
MPSDHPPLPQRTIGEKSPKIAREFTTISGHPIRELYTPADLNHWDADKDLGLPGAPPYTRGIHPAMYRNRLWTMRQFAGFGSAQDTNERFKYLLSQGQSGLSVAFDLPTTPTIRLPRAKLASAA